MPKPRVHRPASARDELRRGDGRRLGAGRGRGRDLARRPGRSSRPAALDAFQILTIPGGFSYGDDLGAGRIFATRLGTVLGDALRRFHDRGGLVLGICNGFQVLVKAGLLPGGPRPGPATLTFNDSGHFESRWVRLLPDARASARS